MATTPNAPPAQGMPPNYPVLIKDNDHLVTNIGSFNNAQLLAFYMATPPTPKPTTKPHGGAARDAYDETGHMIRMRQLPIQRRLELSPGVTGGSLQAERPTNWEAVMGTVTGRSMGLAHSIFGVSPRACDHCQNPKAHPKFARCVLLPGWTPTRCTNCHYNRTGSRFCSFQVNEKNGTSYVDDNGNVQPGRRP